MARGVAGLERMAPDERRVAAANVEVLILTAFRRGPNEDLREPAAVAGAGEVLVRLGWITERVLASSTAGSVVARVLAADE